MILLSELIDAWNVKSVWVRLLFGKNINFTPYPKLYIVDQIFMIYLYKKIEYQTIKKYI